MRLITTPESPFGARVLIAARAKQLELECVRPPVGGVKSAEYLALNPIGKIPLLITDTGEAIPESQSILNYLQARFPMPSLLPNLPEQSARVDVAIRVVDLYVMAPVIRLFPHLNPAARDERTVENELTRWKQGLASLAHFMRTPLPPAHAAVTLADCVLPPSLHLSARIARMLGVEGDLLEPHQPLLEYYARMQDHPVVGPVLDELTAAQTIYDAKAARKSH
jgi:glutathione S-transferase